jgi:hypothetical protein
LVVILQLLLQEQQKNMMDLLGQHLPASLSTARGGFAGNGTQALALAFGGDAPTRTAATEEWTGAGAAVTKTITVS